MNKFPFLFTQLHHHTERYNESSRYHMELTDWMEERRNKVFKQPTELDIDMDSSDVSSIKAVLSNIKKNASYGAGSTGSNS